jgi:hypothetical protein
MARKKVVPPITEPKIEKPKSLLDKPIKEFFSFNVDNTIRDTADRTRGIPSKILNDPQFSPIFSMLARRSAKRQKYKSILTTLIIILGFCVVSNILFPNQLMMYFTLLLGIAILYVYVQKITLR